MEIELTTAVQIALIAAAPPTVVALAAFVVSLLNRGKIHQVHVSLNSRLSELIEASKDVGRQEERDSASKKGSRRERS